MKKRDYLSPHTWQESNLKKNTLFMKSINSSTSMLDQFKPKKSLKIGRYLALLCLAILIAMILLNKNHHQSSDAHSTKDSLHIAQLNSTNPIIQTITLPGATTSNPSTA
jgi:hypothetical protein